MNTYQEISCPECGATVLIPPPYTSWTCENCGRTGGGKNDKVRNRSEALDFYGQFVNFVRNNPEAYW